MKEKILYHNGAKVITQSDIETGLRQVGLKRGDIVMVHSDLGVFGKLGDIHDKDVFLDSILEGFLNVLGKEGTLIIPTFTFSFCKGEVFDVKNSSSTVGIFGEHIRKKKGALRSLEPIYSCAGIGRKVRELLEGVGYVCLGNNSVFDRLYHMDGKLMLFGRPFDITYTHYVENAFGVSYRFNKVFKGTIIDEEGSRFDHEVKYYVRYLDRKVNYDNEKIEEELFRRGLLKKYKLGNSHILLCNARDVFAVIMDMLKKNEYAFLKNPPVEAGKS